MTAVPSPRQQAGRQQQRLRLAQLALAAPAAGLAALLAHDSASCDSAEALMGAINKRMESIEQCLGVAEKPRKVRRAATANDAPSRRTPPQLDVH
jgi:hypothetical protein